MFLVSFFFFAYFHKTELPVPRGRIHFDDAATNVHVLAFMSTVRRRNVSFTTNTTSPRSLLTVCIIQPSWWRHNEQVCYVILSSLLYTISSTLLKAEPQNPSSSLLSLKPNCLQSYTFYVYQQKCALTV